MVRGAWCVVCGVWCVKHYNPCMVTRNVFQMNDSQAVAQQRERFMALLQTLGKGTETQIEATLTERQIVEPEPDLHPETIEKLKRLIAERRASLA